MDSPTLQAIRDNREQIEPYILETPVWQWHTREISELVGDRTEVFLKLELFQHTGTFKPRGALSVMLNLSPESLKRGVTAFTAGNHAIALSYAAQRLNTTAKVVMPKNANPARVALSKSYGAEVELVEDIRAALERVHQIEAEEGRAFVHPFEGPLTTLGTASVGLEFCQQVPDLDAVIVAIGGGGLCSGVAAAVKLLNPTCKVYGVEPEGADSMYRSFASGKPEALDKVRTIADSLGPPHSEPYSFAMCQKFVDDLVLVSDDEMRRAMRLLFMGMRLGVEPAGAAATAALVGSLRERLQGSRVGVVICGSNIDVAGFAAQIAAIEE